MDREDGDVSSSMEWRSNIDGLLGTGGRFEKQLSAGRRTITVSAADSKGTVTAVSLVVSILADAATSEKLTLRAEGFLRYRPAACAGDVVGRGDLEGRHLP